MSSPSRLLGNRTSIPVLNVLRSISLASSLSNHTLALSFFRNLLFCHVYSPNLQFHKPHVFIFLFFVSLLAIYICSALNPTDNIYPRCKVWVLQLLVSRHILQDRVSFFLFLLFISPIPPFLKPQFGHIQYPFLFCPPIISLICS